MKKKLTLRPAGEQTEAPVLQRKGRGWNIAESRLDTLHEAAREMRRNPTEAQRLLAEGLVRANLGKYRLHRQVVIGSAIVDFACQPLRIAVEVDEADSDPAIDRRRDRSLAGVGIKVLRIAAADVLADVDAAVAGIVSEMKNRWHEQRSGTRTGPDGGRQHSGGRGYQR